ncbi:MAG: carboxymuconolactone decarboxylase family protein [Deltaproteobacteria bacterium]|nr:carboxymuconolactone decarboxylase family protein [Deltaproteobacteria bacterium]
MNDKKENDMTSLREFAAQHFNGWKEKYRLMGDKYPETMERMMRARVALNDGALKTKEVELITLGLDISKLHNDVETQTVRAMQAGATAQQVAEVVGICLLKHGMVTYEEAGVRALKTAEDYEADPEGAIKRVEALHGGVMSGLRFHDQIW